jgi:hypothetical protein
LGRILIAEPTIVALLTNAFGDLAIATEFLQTRLTTTVAIGAVAIVTLFRSF